MNNEKKEKLVIEFEGPDEWTQGDWLVYSKARDAYFTEARKAGGYTDPVTANFVGAKALIDKSIVRIRNADALVKIIRDVNPEHLDTVKLNVLNLVGDAVTELINQAFADPLDRYLNAPPPTSQPADLESRSSLSRNHPKS